MKIRELKQGDYFTLKQIDEPKESQVWVPLVEQATRILESGVCLLF